MFIILNLPLKIKFLYIKYVIIHIIIYLEIFIIFFSFRIPIWNHFIQKNPILF